MNTNPDFSEYYDNAISFLIFPTDMKTGMKK